MVSIHASIRDWLYKNRKTSMDNYSMAIISNKLNLPLNKLWESVFLIYSTQQKFHILHLKLM